MAEVHRRSLQDISNELEQLTKEREKLHGHSIASLNGEGEPVKGDGMAAVERLKANLIESGLNLALLVQLREAGPVLLEESWALPRNKRAVEAERQQLKAANNEAEAVSGERCDALRKACEEMGQVLSTVEQRGLDAELNELSEELAAVERLEAALQRSGAADEQAPCTVNAPATQQTDTEEAAVAALTHVQGELQAALQYCSLTEGFSHQIAAIPCKGEHLTQHTGANATNGSAPAMGSLHPPVAQQQPASGQDVAGQAVAGHLAELVCPASLSAHTATSLSLHLRLPHSHSLSQAHTARATQAFSIEPRLAQLPAAVASVEPAIGDVAEEGRWAAMEVHVLPDRGVADTIIEAEGLQNRSLALLPSSQRLKQQQVTAGMAVQVAVPAAVSEAACSMHLLALRKQQVAHALATAPLPPRFLVEQTAPDSFSIKWASGAAVSLQACADWPMAGGHLAVAAVQLPHTAPAAEANQKLLAPLCTALGAMQQEGGKPVTLAAAIQGVEACLRRAVMVQAGK